jgi:hypothetical protein
VAFVTDIVLSSDKEISLFYTFSNSETEHKITFGKPGLFGKNIKRKIKIKPGDVTVWMVEPHYMEDGRHTYYCIDCFGNLNTWEMAHVQFKLTIMDLTNHRKAYLMNTRGIPFLLH